MNNDIEVNSSLPSPKTPTSIFRRLWRFLLFIFLLVLLILLGGITIGYYYQNEVKNYVISELNKQLNTEIIVDGKDIDFTIIKNFPYASVDFKNVIALDAIESKEKDTLFTAEKISLQFNIVDVFHEDYHIKKIKVDNADIDIRIDKNGNDNYHFWKPTPETDTSKFSFALEKIVLNNVQFSYRDRKAKQSINTFINHSVLSGQFSAQKYSLGIDADLLMNKIKVAGESYLRKKSIQLEGSLEVDNTIQSYKVQKGKIKIENLLFEVVGYILTESKTDELILNLGIQGENMNIQSVLSIIPNQYKDRIHDYESDGEFYFNAIIKGSLSEKLIPFIEADFGIKNANITQVKENIVLKNVNLKGHFSNGNKANSTLSILELDSFSANLDQGSVTGELSLHDLNNPSINAKIKAKINLEELQKFIKIDTIENITGQMDLNVSYNGKWKNSSSTSEDDITTGNLKISDMNLKIKNNPLNFNTINGNFNFDNNDLIVNQMTGNVSNSDFELKGIFRNSLNFMLKEDQDIIVEATLHSKNVDLNELLANKEKESKQDSPYKLKFSEHIDVNLKSDIEHISFRKFDATDVKGAIILKDKKMMVDPIQLSTMNGKITLSGLVDASDSTKVMLSCVSEVYKITATKLFIAFENFTQTYVTDQNIKGVVTAKIQFSSTLNPELEMDMSTLLANIDMTIENGELNNVESMKSLSRFIDLKELASVRFATLKNSFEIKDRTLSFPKMEIKSSAINIDLSGTHTFNNEINYKIKLSLNELLAKKAKRAKKQNEFGELADDGLGRSNIFLSMTGTVDNPIIKYDTKGAIQNIKLEIKEEKHTLKSMLKEEFGLFKKDTSLNKKVKKEDPKFNIKWEEEEKKGENNKLKMPKKQDDDDF